MRRGKQLPATQSPDSATIPGLDLTGIPLEENKADPGYPTEVKREDTRKVIALGLLAMLAAVAVGWVAIALTTNVDASSPVIPALDKIFAGVLALTGTAVGFYFGASSTAAKPK